MHFIKAVIFPGSNRTDILYPRYLRVFVKEISYFYYPFWIKRYGQGLEIKIENFSKADRLLKSRLRAVVYKAAYCVHCRGCEVECPTGALKIHDTVRINEEACIHCCNCLNRRNRVFPWIYQNLYSRQPIHYIHCPDHRYPDQNRS